MTSIQISNEPKELLNSFGTKGETYEQIIKRIYKLAVSEQLRKFLLSDKNTITLEEAIKIENKL